MQTLGSMRAGVERWVRESVDTDMANDAINDAVEALWQTIVQWRLGLFLNGPVMLDIEAGAERVALVSVPNPEAAPAAHAELVEGTLPARSLSIAYTLVTESGTETLTSPALALEAPENTLAEVVSPDPVAGAYGWNLYVGGLRQNEQPLRFGDSFIEPPMGFGSDAQALAAAPVENSTSDDIFHIRHLEASCPGGILQSWPAADLDSLLMRRAAGTVAAASEYQAYIWDLVNMNRLEIRPSAAIALRPRYFYIRKPRRLRFDNAPLPFQGLPHERFIRCSALSDIELSLHEYQAAGNWARKAEAAGAEIIQSILIQNRGKNRSIAPYLA